MPELVQQPTEAQRSKARRYLAAGLVRRTGVAEDNKGYGWPSARRESYEVRPLPGRHQVHCVVITEHRDAAEQLVAVDRECDCQLASKVDRECSHILAVHLHRTQENP